MATKTKALPEALTEIEVISRLRLNVTGRGEVRLHPYRALQNLIYKGKKFNGKRVKLRAYKPYGVLLFDAADVQEFWEASKVIA